MRRILSTALALFYGIFSFGVQAQEAPKDLWHLSHVNEPSTGKFNYCAVESAFDNGLALAFARNREFNTNIVVNFPDKRLEAHTKYRMLVDIDTYPARDIVGFAADETVLVVPLQHDHKVLEWLDKGKLLELKGPQDAVKFSLDGVNAALQQLEACVEKSLKEETGKTPKSPILPSAKMADNTPYSGTSALPPQANMVEPLPLPKVDAAPLKPLPEKNAATSAPAASPPPVETPATSAPEKTQMAAASDTQTAPLPAPTAPAPAASPAPVPAPATPVPAPAPAPSAAPTPTPSSPVPPASAEALSNSVVPPASVPQTPPAVPTNSNPVQTKPQISAAPSKQSAIRAPVQPTPTPAPVSQPPTAIVNPATKIPLYLDQPEKVNAPPQPAQQAVSTSTPPPTTPTQNVVKPIPMQQGQAANVSVPLYLDKSQPVQVTGTSGTQPVPAPMAQATAPSAPPMPVAKAPAISAPPVNQIMPATQGTTKIPLYLDQAKSLPPQNPAPPAPVAFMPAPVPALAPISALPQNKIVLKEPPLDQSQPPVAPAPAAKIVLHEPPQKIADAAPAPMPPPVQSTSVSQPPLYLDQAKPVSITQPQPVTATVTRQATPLQVSSLEALLASAGIKASPDGAGRKSGESYVWSDSGNSGSARQFTSDKSFIDGVLGDLDRQERDCKGRFSSAMGAPVQKGNFLVSEATVGCQSGGVSTTGVALYYQSGKNLTSILQETPIGMQTQALLKRDKLEASLQTPN